MTTLTLPRTLRSILRTTGQPPMGFDSLLSLLEAPIAVNLHSAVPASGWL